MLYQLSYASATRRATRIRFSSLRNPPLDGRERKPKSTETIEAARTRGLLHWDQGASGIDVPKMETDGERGQWG